MMHAAAKMLVRVTDPDTLPIHSAAWGNKAT